MNNYMKRLVSTKKKTKDEEPPAEAAPVGTTSPIASRAKSSRHRINRLLPSGGKAGEVAPSVPSRNVTTTATTTAAGNNDKGTKPTSNRPSPRRIRQYMRSANNKGSSSAAATSSSESPSSEEHHPPKKTNDYNTNVEIPPTATWMLLEGESDSDTDDDELFLSPKQGPMPWDEGPESRIGMTSSPMLIIAQEKENIERELVEVKMDRDVLRQQLSDARAELDVARSTLRDNVSDLEEQLRNYQQSERRQAELEENALLEEEIDQLARLAREQEDKKAAAELTSGTQRDNHDGDGTTVSSEGAVKFPTNSAGTSLDKTSGLLIPHEEQSQKKRCAELEQALEERKLREHNLEDEIRNLKEQARLESKKFEESQRQVRWFQRELKAMFPQEGDTSSLSSAEESTGLKNHGDDNQDNAAHLETIMESNAGVKGDEHKSEEGTNDTTFDGDSGSKEENSTDRWIDKTSPFINFVPSDSSMENTTDGSIDNSNKHVKLLHKQRLELEHRVQELLDEIGTLRLGERTYQHNKQQSDIQVLQLQTDLQEQQEQHRLELLLVQRQLEEWKGRSDSFQSNLKEGRNLAEHLNTQSQLERKERQELAQRVELLEIEKNELKDTLEKSRIDFEHEKGYLKKAMESLENNLQRKSENSENVNSNNADSVLSHEGGSRESHAALSEPQILEHDLSRDEKSLEGLLDRIKGLEAERESRMESERVLRERLKSITEQEKLAKDEAAVAEDRVRVLQTFLDASFTASPKKERQRELKEEYISIQSRNHDEEESNREEFDEVLSKSEKDPANDINSDSPKSVKNVEVSSDSIKTEDEDFFDTQQSTSELSTHLGQNRSPESPIGTTKLRDIDEQSISSDAVVHNMHLKLEEEMGNLKKRKQLRRSRAASTDRSVDKGVGKYRTLLDSSSGLLHTKPKVIDASGDHINISKEQDYVVENSDDFELTQLEQSKADDELRKKLEEENSSLGTALETANYKKAQLEIDLGDALQKISDFTTRIDALNAEVLETRGALELHEKEKIELTNKIVCAQDEMVTLKSNICEVEEEKKSFEAKLSDLKETLATKDRIILENDESHRKKLDEMKRELDESLRAKEDDSASSKISDLEAKLLRMEAESKANVELLSKNLEGVLEERNALELKFRDACKELDECKESESELRATAQEIIEKLKSAQSDIENLSQSKELESKELEKTISEKNRRIVDLEEDLSCKGKRLEQAALQMSELENELFEREEEIEKLDARRLQIQESASKQLVEMENFLEKEAEEIDRLKEEKSKLQDLAQNQEQQIEKQLGRLAEASLQLSELESEVFAKDEEIEEMELRINAMQALEAQRSEILQDPGIQKKSLELQLESSNQTIQNLTSQVETIKQERESEKTEAQRLLIEDGKKTKEILSRQNQLDRQLQNVSKLTEQNDKWQQQLEKAHEEKQELLDGLSDVKTQLVSLGKELEDSNEKIKELNATNRRLQDDLVCATEEDEKNRVRISQMEDQKEVLSQKLESAMDNLAELLKQNEEVRELDEKLSTGIIQKLQANLQSAQAVDEETESLIKNLTEQVEFERRSLHTSEVQRSELETENEALKNRIRAFVEMNSKSSSVDV